MCLLHGAPILVRISAPTATKPQQFPICVQEFIIRHTTLHRTKQVHENISNFLYSLQYLTNSLFKTPNPTGVDQRGDTRMRKVSRQTGLDSCRLENTDWGKKRQLLSPTRSIEYAYLWQYTKNWLSITPFKCILWYSTRHPISIFPLNLRAKKNYKTKNLPSIIIFLRIYLKTIYFYDTQVLLIYMLWRKFSGNYLKNIILNEIQDEHLDSS